MEDLDQFPRRANAAKHFKRELFTYLRVPDKI